MQDEILHGGDNIQLAGTAQLLLSLAVWQKYCQMEKSGRQPLRLLLLARKKRTEKLDTVYGSEAGDTESTALSRLAQTHFAQHAAIDVTLPCSARTHIG